eukprot:scpid62094/ scgid9173/ 
MCRRASKNVGQVKPTTKRSNSRTTIFEKWGWHSISPRLPVEEGPPAIQVSAPNARREAGQAAHRTLLTSMSNEASNPSGFQVFPIQEHRTNLQVTPPILPLLAGTI